MVAIRNHYVVDLAGRYAWWWRPRGWWVAAVISAFGVVVAAVGLLEDSDPRSALVSAGVLLVMSGAVSVVTMIRAIPGRRPTHATPPSLAGLIGLFGLWEVYRGSSSRLFAGGSLGNLPSAGAALLLLPCLVVAVLFSRDWGHSLASYATVGLVSFGMLAAASTAGSIPFQVRFARTHLGMSRQATELRAELSRQPLDPLGEQRYGPAPRRLGDFNITGVSAMGRSPGDCNHGMSFTLASEGGATLLWCPIGPPVCCDVRVGIDPLGHSWYLEHEIWD